MESFEIESGKPIVPTPVSDISSDYLELVEKKISTVDAMKELGKRAIPSIFGLMLKHIVDLLNITFAGRLEDPEAIDGVGLGLLSYNCLVFSVAWGMTGAIDTFVSQAYGQKKYYLCGTILNKGKIIMAILSAHQCILMLFIGDIFIILNQPKNPSRICQEFIRYQIIGLVCVNQFECIRRFLTAQGVYNIIVQTQVISLIIHILMLTVLVSILEYGVVGIAISTCVTNILNLTLITLYCSYKEGFIPKESWHWYNKDSFKGWDQFLQIAVPSTIMRSLEYSSIEVLAIFTGLIGYVEQSASIANFQISSYFYRIPNGISIASTSLIGNCLGSRQHINARKYTVSAILIVIMVAFVILTGLMIFNNQIIRLFTYQEEIIEVGAKLLYITAIFTFFDAFQGCLAGTILAMGKQKLGSIINLVSYLAIMIPLSYFLGFTLNYGVYGIYIGSISGVLSVFVMYVYLICKIDWEKLANEVYSLVRKQNDELVLFLDEKESQKY